MKNSTGISRFLSDQLDHRTQQNRLQHNRPHRAGRNQGAIVLALAASGVLGLAGCRGGGGGGQKVTPVKAVAPTATQVSVTPARIGSIAQTQPITGALSAENDVTVGAKLAGKVVAVYYREGAAVKTGQIVAQQDQADLQAQLDQQRANLASAQTRLSQARVTLQNAQTTLKLTGEQTSSAVAESKAALDASRQQLAVVKNGARTQERQQAVQAVSQAQADRESSRADLVSAQADYTRAQSDLKRYQSLYAQSAIPAQQLDQYKSVADSAKAHVDAAQARVSAADSRVKSAQESLSLIQEGARTEDVRRAEASAEQARQGFLTAQSNRAQVNLRRADVDTAQAGIVNAQAGVQQAEAAVRLAEQGLRDAAIRSPINGVVAERKIEPGAQIGAGKDVMRIVALDSIYFDAQLPEALYTKVSIGQTVSLNISAFPNRAFKGIVNKIFPVASSAARNFTVRISLPNEGNLLRPQMFARGEIVLNTHPHAVLVPRDAVLDNTGTTGRVFLVKGKTAKEQTVKLGFANMQDVEITSGVQAGDQVVTMGQAQLQDNVPVQILTGTQSADAKL